MLRNTLLPEIKHEAGQTRKMLENVPFEEAGWKPHEKSMLLGRLAAHVAEIPGWVTRIISTDEIDASTYDFKRYAPSSTEDLLQFFDRTLQSAVESLSGCTDERLLASWTFRRGDKILISLPRVAAIRAMAMNHLIHHRGQLSVYLRLLNRPVPGMYGPSADDLM